MLLFVCSRKILSAKQAAIRAFGACGMVFMFAAGNAFAASGAHVLELGLTPSHVFSLWTNINDALVTIAQIESDDLVWQTEIGAMKVQSFEGKTPADVLVRVSEFELRVDKSWSDIKTAPVWMTVDVVEKVTPSKVFIDSGHVLNDVISRLIKISDSSLLVSRFFARHKFSGKTPSDVFGLVDLAHRRLDRIFAKQAELE